MKVLIVRLSAIGDVIQGIPCLVALKESFPDWQISWLVEETSAPLLENHPCLSRLFVLRRDWRKKDGVTATEAAEGASNYWSVLREIRREQFDVTIDLQGLFKSGLWTWLSGAPRRVGHNKTRELAHWFLNEYAGDRPTFDPAFPLVERYLEPARHLGADVRKGRYLLPPSSEKTRVEADACMGTSPKQPVIALCPWSVWPSKNWPLERWRDVALDLAKDFRMLLIGAHSDLPASEIFSAVPNLINLAGKTTLPVLAEIFRRCRVAVGPDSGPLHLANATNAPRIVMIFGSTSWRRSGPRGEGNKAISLDLECQPCFERVCPLDHMNCLNTLDASRVIQAVREVTDITQRSA